MPYHDTEYDVGAKYAITNDLLVTADAFRVTRRLAEANTATNFLSVVGTQRDAGAEVFVPGNLTQDFTVLGGMTYIDARRWGAGNTVTNDMLVVGVPNCKAELAFDNHPNLPMVLPIMREQCGDEHEQFLCAGLHNVGSRRTLYLPGLPET